MTLRSYMGHQKQKQLDLSDLGKLKIGFWALGNFPTQELLSLSESEIQIHLKVLYLLSDKVLGSSSFYLESEITRRVTQKLKYLFERGDIIYFVDSSIEDYREHAMLKIEKSPPGFYAYRNRRVVLERARALDSLGHILRRPSYSISDRIVDLWVEDVNSLLRGSVGELLSRVIMDERKRTKIKNDLIDIAKHREKDFVWEYLFPRIKNYNLPSELIRTARIRLSEIYTRVTSELVGAPVDRPKISILSGKISVSSIYDTSLFLECMDILAIKKYLKVIGPKELVKLKHSIEFLIFREFYFSLIWATSGYQSEIIKFLPIYKEAAEQYSRMGIGREVFLSHFNAFCGSVKRGEGKMKEPLDILISTFDSFQKLPINDFQSLLMILAKRSRAGRDPRIEDKYMKMIDKDGNMIKILFLSADPSKSNRLRIDREIRAIDERLRKSAFYQRFDLAQHWAVTVESIQELMLREKPNIVHFSGHGRKESEIILEDKFGKPHPVPNEALTKLFLILKKDIRCVFLNACFSERQGRAIAQNIDAVIGMSNEIGDDAAIVFAGAFYSALGFAESIKTAFELACNQLHLENLGEHGIPKLIPRDGIDPDRIILIDK